MTKKVRNLGAVTVMEMSLNVKRKYEAVSKGGVQLKDGLYYQAIRTGGI